jgi:hypothetical protein
VYAAIYGVTYGYLLHHIVNLVVAWLAAVHFSTSTFSLRNLCRELEAPGFGDDAVTEGDGHVKKLP